MTKNEANRRTKPANADAQARPASAMRNHILNTAFQLIATHGYEATSLRMLAHEVGLKAPSLYNYIGSKQQLLVELLEHAIQDLTNRSLGQLSVANEGPQSRLRTFVSVHLMVHMERRDQVFVGNSELRSLAAANRERIIKLRKDYENILIDILRDGKEKGDFRIDDLQMTAFGILSMLSGVASWYKPGGRLSRNTIVSVYADNVFRLLGCHNPNGEKR